MFSLARMRVPAPPGAREHRNAASLRPGEAIRGLLTKAPKEKGAPSRLADLVGGWDGPSAGRPDQSAHVRTTMRGIRSGAEVYPASTDHHTTSAAVSNASRWRGH